MTVAENDSRLQMFDRARLPRDTVAAWLHSGGSLQGHHDRDAENFMRQWRLGAELLAKLPQTLLVGLTELVGRNFRIADLGQIRTAEAAEDVVNPPQGKTAGEERQYDAHDGTAEPIGRGFPDTSKHAFPGSSDDDDLCCQPGCQPKAAHHRERRPARQSTELTDKTSLFAVQLLC